MTLLLPKPTHRPRRAVPALILTAGIALAACTAPPPSAHLDPFEDGNRRAHAFNQALDTRIVAPLSGAVQGAGDGPVSAGVSNLAGNLALPGAILNQLLQGRIEDAVHNGWRLALNSTIGIGGLFDPATAMGLDRRRADFGQTLHVWGAGEGAYVVVPIIGPSTERDMLGKVVDAVIDPVGFVLPSPEKYWATGVKFASRIGDRGRFGATVDSILHESADSYAQQRLIYLQNRRFELGQEAGDDDFLDPYEDPYGD